MNYLVLRKKFVFTAVLLIGALGLTGCGASDAPSEDSNVYELQSVKAIEDSNQERIQDAFPWYDFKTLDKTIDASYKQGQTSYIIECNTNDLETLKQWLSDYVQMSPITIGETGEISDKLWSGVDSIEDKYVFFDMSILEDKKVQLVLSKG